MTILGAYKLITLKTTTIQLLNKWRGQMLRFYGVICNSLLNYISLAINTKETVCEYKAYRLWCSSKGSWSNRNAYSFILKMNMLRNLADAVQNSSLNLELRILLYCHQNKNGKKVSRHGVSVYVRKLLAHIQGSIFTKVDSPLAGLKVQQNLHIVKTGE